jgi:hypothetical protein
LTLEPEVTRKALFEAGAEMILGLDPDAGGVQSWEVSGEEVAVAKEI